MYNSPHHPEFTHHYGKLIEMATERGVMVSLNWLPWNERWYIKVGSNRSETSYGSCSNVLSGALEAAIEHLAGVPICK